MTSLRDYAAETVQHALQHEHPGADPAELRDRAESFIAIAEAAHMPIESLIAWIHTPAPAKEWSLAEFRAYCRFWQRLRSEASA